MTFEQFKATLTRLVQLTAEDLDSVLALPIRANSGEGQRDKAWAMFRDDPLRWIEKYDAAARIWPLIAPSGEANIVTDAGTELLRKASAKPTDAQVLAALSQRLDPYVFTPGEYKTRDGRKAVVLTDDAPGSWPLMGYITALGVNSAPHSWRATGLSESGCPPNDSDLMPSSP